MLRTSNQWPDLLALPEVNETLIELHLQGLYRRLLRQIFQVLFLLLQAPREEDIIVLVPETELHLGDFKADWSFA